MKIGIIGGREFDNETLIQNSIDDVIGPLEDSGAYVVFLGGGSKGAERVAEDHITHNLKLDYVLFRPYNFVDTKVPHHPKYFYYRNKQIVENADVLIIFDDGKEGNLAKTVFYIQNSTAKDYHIYYLDGTSLHRDTMEIRKDAQA